MQQIKNKREAAAAQDRTGDLQIFSLTLSQLSYSGFEDMIFKKKKKKKDKKKHEHKKYNLCVNRESNPDLMLGKHEF